MLRFLMIVFKAAKDAIRNPAKWLRPRFARNTTILAGIKNQFWLSLPRSWTAFRAQALGSLAFGAATSGVIIAARETWMRIFSSEPRPAWFNANDTDIALERDPLFIEFAKDTLFSAAIFGIAWNPLKMMFRIMKDLSVVGAKVVGVPTLLWWGKNQLPTFLATAEAVGANTGVKAADDLAAVLIKVGKNQKLTDEESDLYQTWLRSTVTQIGFDAAPLTEDEKAAKQGTATGDVDFVDRIYVRDNIAKDLGLGEANYDSAKRSYFITSASVRAEPAVGPVRTVDAVVVPAEKTVPADAPRPAQLFPATPTTPAPLWPARTHKPLFHDARQQPLFDRAGCQDVEEDVLRDLFDLYDDCACEQEHDEAIMLSDDPIAARRAKMDFFLSSIGKAVSSVGKSVMTKGSPVNTILSNMPGVAGTVFKGATDVAAGYKAGGFSGALGAGLGALASNASGAASLASGGLAGGLLGGGGPLAAAGGLMQQQGTPVMGVAPMGMAPSGPGYVAGWPMGGQPMYEIRGRVVLAPPGLSLVPLGGPCVPAPAMSDAHDSLGDYEPFGPIDRRSYHEASPGVARLGAVAPTGEVITIGAFMDYDLVSDRLHALCKNGALRRMVHRVRDTGTFDDFITALVRLVKALPTDVMDEVGGETGVALYFMADRAKQHRNHDYFKKFRRMFKKLKPKKALKTLKRVGLGMATGGLSELARLAKKMKKKGKRGEAEAEEEAAEEAESEEEGVEPLAPSAEGMTDEEFEAELAREQAMNEASDDPFDNDRPLEARSQVSR